MRDRLRRAAPALLGLALLGLFFASTLDPAVQLYYRDTGRLYYPVKLYIARELRAGRLPLWDTMTECGVSLLGQVTPGLLHPATLLYLVFPFDLAFKLNHALGPLLGGIGAWLLARRLGASPWARLVAAVAYGGSGYLVSVTGSNLPFAVGAGTVPIAIDAALAFAAGPSIGRLAWGGAAMALIAFAGEPQAALIAGVLSVVWAAANGATLRGAARNVGLVGCCGALALAFAAPAILPAVVQLRRSTRAGPLSEREKAVFANHPVRLAGLLVPRAFDDAPEAIDDRPVLSSTYTEYFAQGDAAFADSIVIGAPALLLAAAAAAARRRGRVLFGGACLLALASTGTALGIDRVVFALVPLAGIFRFAEKLMAPVSLLFAVAAALGADVTLAGTRRAASRLALASGLLAVACGVLALLVGANSAALAEATAAFGKSHRAWFAEAFWREARAGLFDCAALSATLALLSAWRASRQRAAVALGAVCCAASVFASCGGLLYTAPVRIVRGPFDLADRLKARAGPSPGRWRLFVNDRPPLAIGDLPPRASAAYSAAEALMPQFNSVVGIEGIGSYFSAGDPLYYRGIVETPETYFNLLGVRFAVEMPTSFTARGAALRNFHKLGYGYWVREYPVGARAFVVAQAVRVATADEGLARVAAGDFDVRRQAVFRGGDAALLEGSAAPAQLDRASPERMDVRARGPGLLVVGEHFDPGWEASIDGRRVPVLETDLAAMGVPLPAGDVAVRLRFVPVGLRAGLAIALACAGALAVAAVAHRKRSAAQ